MTNLTPAELSRYDRHLTLPEVGLEGQERLKASKVLLIGAGGLGSPLALYLAAAGVGTLGILDFDRVDESNLQRQVLHGTSEVGQSKAESARRRLSDLNPHVQVVVHDTRLATDNAKELFDPYDLVVDGSDNFPTRYLVNDACFFSKKPYVHGSIFRFEGQVSVFAPGVDGPCYRCLFPEPPPSELVPSCAEGGVLGILPGVIGSLQATEVIKHLLGIGRNLQGSILTFNALQMRFSELKLNRDRRCPLCGDAPTITELSAIEEVCSFELPGLNEEQFRGWLREKREFTLIDVREPHEWEVANLMQHGARLVPLATLTEALPTIATDQTVVVHCKSGSRARKAQTVLLDSGFPEVVHLKFGPQSFNI